MAFNQKETDFVLKTLSMHPNYKDIILRMEESRNLDITKIKKGILLLTFEFAPWGRFLENLFRAIENIDISGMEVVLVSMGDEITLDDLEKMGIDRPTTWGDAYWVKNGTVLFKKAWTHGGDADRQQLAITRTEELMK
jgi:hypothetical protein